ncbi:MAG: biotin/lipoyl-binding protein [Magnetococcales bacterium]|nr:biotin/lipoyl-binding protein [Magnetococcales bacterium]
MERKLRITIEGAQYEVHVQDITDGDSAPVAAPAAPAAPVTPKPAATPAKSSSKKAAAAAPAGGDAETDRTAPMGGVVVQVLVKEGQTVAKGDKVLILEAMKQKADVFAHRAGTIKGIACKEGDAVETGQRLMSIV